MHPSLMHGTLGVKPTAQPPSGPVGTQFAIGVATVSAPAGYTYDIQMKAPGGVWMDWHMGWTQATAPFDSTGVAPGGYRFRSKLHKVANNSSSMYSPAVSVIVT